MANIFDEELKRRTFGAADSDPAMFTGGALDALNTIAGGASQGQQAMELARALSPKPQEFDLATAALKYFTGLTREASKPGATLFGAAATATADPAEYLMDVKDYNRKLEASLPQTAIKLASSLKPPKGTGTTTYKSIIIKMKDGTEKQDYVPVSDIPKIKALENVVSVLEDRSDKSGAQFKRTVYKPDGSSKVTYSLEDFNKSLLPVSETNPDGGFSDVKPAGSESEETPQWVTVTETVPSADEGGEPTINKSTKLLKPSEINALAEDANKTVTKMEALFTYKDIRDAYSKDQDFKDFKALQTNFDKVNTSYEQAYNLPSPKVADLSMIFAYMKMLDPRSVVREGEQQQARGTGGMFDYLANTYNSLLGEGSLTDLQRKSFRDAAFAFYNKNATLLTELNGRIVNEAQNQNIQNVGDFIIQPRTYLEPDNLPNGDPNPKAGQSTLKVFAKYPGDDKITDPTQVSLEDLSFLLTAPITTRLTEENKNKIRAEITRRTQ